MDIGLFTGKRSALRLSRVSRFLTIFCILSAAVAFLSLGTRTTCPSEFGPRVTAPMPSSLPHLSARDSDETILFRQILQKETRSEGVTHVGIERERNVLVDPDPSLMRVLTAANPTLRPVSDLANRKAQGTKQKFILITAGHLEWESANQARVCRIYRSSRGGHSRLVYTANRTKMEKVGWSLQPELTACGYWRPFRIQTTRGKFVTFSQ